MEHKTSHIGKNGVPFDIIQVYNTPLENILNIGKRIGTKKRLEKTFWEKPLTKEQKLKKKEIMEKIHKDMNTYINSIK